jgi:ABC-type branched-subunit amino acid transport system substrate-binding protein
MICFRLFLPLTLLLALTVQAHATPLKVGVIVPLSGPFASYGEVARQGFELAQKEDPASFKDIVLLYEDSKHDGKTSVSAFRKLVDQDRVDLVFVWGVTPAEVIAPLTKSSKMPTILYTLDKTIHQNNPWIIRAKSTYQQFGKKLSDYLAAQGRKKLAIFKVEISFYNEMYEGLKTAAIQNGQSVVFLESSPPDNFDFRSSISKFKRSGADAVGIYLIPGQIAQFYQQLSEQNVKLPTFGTEDIGTRSEIEKAPAQMEGAVFTANIVDESFRESFLRSYKSDSNIWHAAQTYELAHFFTLIQSDPTAEQILETFRTAPLRAGALGMPERESFPGGGVSLTYPVGVEEIKNGRVVELQ